MLRFEVDPKDGRPKVMQMLGSPKFLDELKQSDIIRGRDEKTGDKFLIFGRSTLAGIISAGQAMEYRVVEVPILQETLELEALLAAVRVAKGYDEYEATKSYS